MNELPWSLWSSFWISTWEMTWNCVLARLFAGISWCNQLRQRNIPVYWNWQMVLILKLEGAKALWKWLDDSLSGTEVKTHINCAYLPTCLASRFCIIISIRFFHIACGQPSGFCKGMSMLYQGTPCNQWSVFITFSKAKHRVTSHDYSNGTSSIHDNCLTSISGWMMLLALTGYSSELRGDLDSLPHVLAPSVPQFCLFFATQQLVWQKNNITVGTFS